MRVVPHIKGDTFSASVLRLDASGGHMDVTGTAILCQARLGGAEGPLVQEFAITKTDAALGSFTIWATAAETALWPEDLLVCDIGYFDGAEKRSTRTFGLWVQGGVNRAD